MIDKNKVVYNFYQISEKLFMIPPVLIGGYLLNKSLGEKLINIDIEKLNAFYDMLSKDLLNSISLGTTFAGSMLVGNKNAKLRITGSVLFLLNNIYFVNEAFKHNPEPMFISQMAIFSYLSAKTIINESLNLNEKVEKRKLNSKLKNFLKTKKIALKNGFKRFGLKVKKYPEMLSTSFVALAVFSFHKYNLDYENVKNILSLISSKVPEIVAFTTSILGANEISKGNLFKAGNYFLTSNCAWLLKPNSELHQLLTVLYMYTASLTAKNGLEMLNNKKEKETLINKVKNVIKKNDKILKKNEKRTEYDNNR